VLLLEGAATLEKAGEVLCVRGVLVGEGAYNAGSGTDPSTRNAGFEAVEERRHAHVRVQHLVHQLLRLRVLRCPLLHG
jgi:hypothetical protein